MGKIIDINQQAKDNTNFRHVLETGKHTQVVIMSIEPGSEIGEEVHEENDQVLYLVAGKGKVVLDDVESDYGVGDMVVVPAGTKHNFITTGDEAMKIITTYSPPHHPDGTIHATKEDAEAAEATE
jgi:mannose-6-phosphate isomerase-like protein (cupin superfamily)